MKKIILTVVLCLSFSIKVKAENLDSSLIKTNSKNISICMDGKSYPIRKIGAPGSNLYFLNPSDNYNYNFDDYYEVDISQTPYSKDIYEYLSYYYIHGFEHYYYESTQKKLWEVLYPGKFPYFCSSSSELVSKMIETDELMANVENGPDLVSYPNFLEVGEKLSFTFTYFSHFEIYDDDGLNAKIEGDNLLVSSNQEGKYDLILKRKDNGLHKNTLFTDGTNYLITSGPFPSKEYHIKIYVGYKKFSFEATDEEGNTLNNKEFIITGEKGQTEIIETNFEGKGETYLPVGEYFISEVGSSYKNYFFIEDDFSLKTVVKSSNDSQNTINKPNIPDVSQSIPSTLIPIQVEDKVQDIIKPQKEQLSVVFPDTLWLT